MCENLQYPISSMCEKVRMEVGERWRSPVPIILMYKNVDPATQGDEVYVCSLE